MKLGTKSLLFGAHQFLLHPVTVLLAWRKLYGSLPSLRECLCIFVHDWGYWGSPDMDGEQGKKHPLLGAKIAGTLFGEKYFWLTLLHSRSLAKRIQMEPSKLCWADKAAFGYEWSLFYLLRTALSGELPEYRVSFADRVPLSFDSFYWFDFVKYIELPKDVARARLG